MIKAILFDLDGTLIYRQKSAYLLYRDLVKKFCPHITDENEIENAVQSLINWDEFGHINKHIPYTRFQEKYQLPKEDVQKMVDFWLDNIAKYTIVFDKSFSTLKELKKRYKLAIVTNGAEQSQGAKIEQLGFKEIFDSIVITGKINSHKPEELPYLTACDELGVKPNECVFVGDTFHTDIIGAKRLNMETVWICSDPARASYDLVKRIEKIEQLLNLY